jgi:hypothetical protein
MPVFSVNQFKIGILLHMILGLFMLTNPSIFETKESFEHSLDSLDDYLP